LGQNEGKPVKSDNTISETQIPVLQNKWVTEPRTMHQLTMLLKISEAAMRKEILEGRPAEQRTLSTTSVL
jgi:hypothetical protein